WARGGGADVGVAVGGIGGARGGGRGGFPPPPHLNGDVNDQVGTFMHELGHTLGLRHGGPDNDNCKPNYLSVMSYSRQFSDGVPLTARRLDYSRSALLSLNESSLQESFGIGAVALPSGFTTAEP